MEIIYSLIYFVACFCLGFLSEQAFVKGGKGCGIFVSAGSLMLGIMVTLNFVAII